VNLLFLYTSPFDPIKGGVQRVSSVLGEYFKNAGHNIYYLSLKKSSNDIQHQYYLPDENKFNTFENIQFFQNILVKNKIEYVINQGAFGPECSDFSYLCLPVGAKLISVIHNSPLASIKNFSGSKNYRFKKYGLAFILPLTELTAVKKVILLLYKKKYKSHYTRLINRSHTVLLLSDSFKNELQFFYSKKLPNTVQSIPNPISFEASDFSIEDKEKVALFVGRVDFAQKRVDLLLKIWLKISNKNPDWKLKIIGEGPDLAVSKKFCQNHKLSSVLFEGFQNPIPYYIEASILCMTSSFEGFGLVLVEALNFGCVPIAFRSFSSITDIISDKKNGILVEPFKIDDYANELSKLMSSPERIKVMAAYAMADSQRFSLTSVAKQWVFLFDQLEKR